MTFPGLKIYSSKEKKTGSFFQKSHQSGLFFGITATKRTPTTLMFTHNILSRSHILHPQPLAPLERVREGRREGKGKGKRKEGGEEKRGGGIREEGGGEEGRAYLN